MRKPGTDPENVRMSDVLCDFCEREWTEDVPMLEGHEGSCVCGSCLTAANRDVAGAEPATTEYTCPMCLENGEDRASLNRAGEPGWPSPLREGVVMCRRCIKLAAGALERDKDFDWSRNPGAQGAPGDRR